MALLTLVSLLFVAPANAQSLADQKEMKEQEQKLANAVLKMNEACGTKIPATFDWASATKANAEMPKPAVDGDRQWLQGPNYCAGYVEGIASICVDEPPAKSAVAQKIKRVECKFDASVTKKKSGPLGASSDVAGTPPVPHLFIAIGKDGTVKVSYDWFVANIRDEMRNWVRTKL